MEAGGQQQEASRVARGRSSQEGAQGLGSRQVTHWQGGPGPRDTQDPLSGSAETHRCPLLPGTQSFPPVSGQETTWVAGRALGVLLAHKQARQGNTLEGHHLPVTTASLRCRDFTAKKMGHVLSMEMAGRLGTLT